MHVCARTRACIRWRLPVQEQRCGGQRPGKRCGRLKEAVARDDGREEETGDVYVVVILRVCTRKISIRDVSTRANEDANVLVVPYFGCAPGKAGE